MAKDVLEGFWYKICSCKTETVARLMQKFNLIAEKYAVENLIQDSRNPATDSTAV